MLKDVIPSGYKGGYKIEVTFQNGVAGTFDFSKYLNKYVLFNNYNYIFFCNLK